MSFSERTIIAELVCSLLVIALFVWLIADSHARGVFEGPDGLTVWARQVLWMIPAGIGVSILLSVILAVLCHATTRAAFENLVDERDRLITAFSWKVTLIMISAGFSVRWWRWRWGPGCS
ncbi:MAG: hypothetical protein ACK4GT_15950 [Pararhodobacter sp.]